MEYFCKETVMWCHQFVYIAWFLGYLMKEFQVKTYCRVDVEGNMNMDVGGLIGHSQSTDKAYYSEIGLLCPYLEMSLTLWSLKICPCPLHEVIEVE
jgi:hypothetical protein